MYFKRYIVFGLLLSGLTLLSSACSDPAKKSVNTPEPDFYLGGIQLNEASDDRWVNKLAEVGMNTVEVTVYGRQGNWHDHNFWFAENEQGVVDEIRTAKAAGLHVTLILRVSLDHAYEDNVFLWHGMIFPETNENLRLWFDLYGRFARKWARIAQEEGVEVFSLGSEMNAMVGTNYSPDPPELLAYYLTPESQAEYRAQMLQFEEVLTEKDLWVMGTDNYKTMGEYLDDQIEKKQNWARKVGNTHLPNPIEIINDRRYVMNECWKALIASVRPLYNGKLTMSANFDSYMDVAFWEQLDYIGINAYFPLRNGNAFPESDEELYEMLKKGWERVLTEIEDFQVRQGLEDKPVYFTELGYGYRSGSTIHPWQATSFSILPGPEKDSLILWEEQPYAPLERQLAVKALRITVKERDFPLIGLLYWKLTTHPYHLSEEPFALWIADPPRDGMQVELARFLEKE